MIDLFGPTRQASGITFGILVVLGTHGIRPLWLVKYERSQDDAAIISRCYG